MCLPGHVPVAGCVEALLQRCPDADAASPAAAAAVAAPTAGAGPGAGGEVRQLVVLHRLAPLLTLPREAASEEVHVGLQRCVAAALQPLAAAAVALQEQRGKQEGEGRQERGQQGRREGRKEETEGSGGPLCGEAAAPLAGYLVHCCLEVSEREVLAGHKGKRGARVFVCFVCTGRQVVRQAMHGRCPAVSVSWHSVVPERCGG